MRGFVFLSLLVLAPAHATAEGKKIFLDQESAGLPVGTKIVEKSAMTMSSKTLELSIGDLRLAGSLSDSGRREEHGMQLTPDRVRYLLRSSNSRKVFRIDGKEDVKEEEQALVGVPVILERDNGKWSARLEKGEANKQQGEELDELAVRWNTDDDRVMYGNGPRRIGESWKVDAADIPAFLGMADGVRGEVVFTLVGEKKVRGVRCARLMGKIDCTALMRGEDEDPDVKISLEGDFEIVRSLVYFEDIAFEMEGKMTMLVEGPSPRGPLAMKSDGPFAMSGSLEIR